MRGYPGAPVLVVAGVGFGVRDHAVDLGRVESTGALDADGLRLARGLVLGRDRDDAVRVDVEGHVDLGHASRRGRQAVQDELPERAGGRSHLALALEHLDLHLGLVVRGRREGLAAPGRNGRVAIDQPRHHAPERLDPER